jgi:hypothetical protein
MLKFSSPMRTFFVLLLAVRADVLAQTPQTIEWRIDNLKKIGGHAVTVVGNPNLIEGPEHRAVEFDGVGDGLFLEVHPLAGQRQFTAEVLFRPAADGPKEQRFFHLQADGAEDRVLFETRLTGDGQWFLDTFVKSAAGECTLYAKDHEHPIGPWYHAAIVIDGQTMRHYVNGKLEMTQPLKFQPHAAGRTSMGVRINKVFWYKGAIAWARFSPRALEPKEMAVQKGAGGSGQGMRD